MLTLTCPECSAAYQAPEKFAGRKMRCRKCASVLTIPSALAGGDSGSTETAGTDRAPKKELEETAVMGELEREEMARTRPGPGGKKTFKPPKRGLAGRTGGFGKGAKGAKGSALRLARGESGADEEVEAGAQGGRKRSPVLLVGGAVLGVIMVLLVLDIAFFHVVFGDRSGSGKPAPRRTVATQVEEPEDSTEEAEGDVAAEREEAAEEGSEGADERVAADAEMESEEGKDAAEGASEEAETGEEPAAGEGDDDTAASAEAETGPGKVAAAGELAAIAGVLPADSQVVVSIDVQKVLGFARKFLARFPLPGALDDLNAAVALAPPDQPAQLQQLAAVLEGMEIDPLEDIHRITIAVGGSVLASLPTFAGGVSSEEPPRISGVLLIDGDFEPLKVVRGLRQMGIVTSAKAEARDGLEVYAAKLGADTGYLGFLSKGRAVVASEDFVGKLADVKSGKAQPLASNDRFAELAGGLTRRDALWIAAEIPQEMLDAIGAASAGESGDGGKDGDPARPGEPPSFRPPKFDAVWLAIDATPNGISFEFLGNTPSPQEATAQVRAVGFQLGTVAMTAMQLVGPEAMPFFNKLRPVAVGNRFKVAFTLSRDEIDKLVALTQKTMARGASAPGIADGEKPGEEPAKPPAESEDELPAIGGDEENKDENDEEP
jgi:hypothetical protein